MSETPGDIRDSRSSNKGMTSEPRTQTGNARLDRDTLAALLDGRLEGAARDAALASLAVSPDDLEIVADVAAISAEIDGDVTDIRSIANRRPKRRPQLTRWIAAAAAIMVAASLPMLIRRDSAPPADGFAALLNRQGALAPGWEGLSWAATRGSSDGLTERARAVRAGALTSAIEVAAARGDSATPRLAAQVAALLVDVPGAGNVVSTYRNIAASRAAVPPQELRDARHAARAMVSSPSFDDGAWLEAAHIAAANHDSAFFATAASRAQLARLEREAGSVPSAHDDVLSVSPAIGRQNWTAVAVTTTNILAQLAAR